MTIATNPTSWPVVCATGHRPKRFIGAPPGTIEWVRAELYRVACKLRDQCGTQIAVSGMALGVDLWWADAAVRAGIPLHAYIPFPTQTARWRRADIAEWRRLCALAAEVKILYPQPADARQANRYLHARNRDMLRASAAAVCVYIPGCTSGGTYGGICDAHRVLADRSCGVHINPVARRTSAGLPSLQPAIARFTANR